MTVDRPIPSSVGTWLSRAIGAALLLEQAAGHALGVPPSTVLIGAGMALLGGRETLEVLRLVFGRPS